jgi:predicted metalloprotease with PDZ domain
MLHYKISCQDRAARYLNISLKLDFSSSQDIIQFQLPAWRPGRYELGNFAQNIRTWQAFDQNGRLLKSKKILKDLWQVEGNGAHSIMVKYEYYAGQLDAGSTFVDHEQIYINPVNCLLYLPERISEKISLKLDIPENYQIASGLNFNLHRYAEASDYHEIADSPIIASAILQHEVFAVGKYVFHLWMQGKCNPDWDRIKMDFWKFTNEQINTFGEFPANEYHFFFQILNNNFYHGVEHLNSTVIALGPGYKLMEKENYDQLLGVSSHELFHSWNIKSIRPAEMYPYDYCRENYSNLGYVAEGVTTYYGDLMLFRSQVFPWEQYAFEFDTFLIKYFNSSGYRFQSVAEASFDTWLDGYKPGTPDRKVNMYVKGMLVAFMLDISIRANTDNKFSLDEVMKNLYYNYAKNAKGYTENDYLAITNKISGVNHSVFFDSYIWGLEPIENGLTQALDYIGLQLHKLDALTAAEHYFGIRYKEDSNKKTVITQLAMDSPSRISGLSVNDEIIAVNGIQAENNFNDLIKYNLGLQINLLISRQKNILEISMEAQPGINFFPIYKINKLENALPEQINNFAAWSRNIF